MKRRWKILIGVVAALRQYSKFDYLATLFAFVFFSMPISTNRISKAPNG